jgi:hypothetical protein
MQNKRVLRLFGVSGSAIAVGDFRYCIGSHGGKIETPDWIRC